jgi:hypothetical protein
MKYTLTVSEPWDFSGPDSENRISGKVLRRIDGESLLFESDSSISIRGISSKYWILSTRYEKQCFENEPYNGTVNGGILVGLPPESEGAAKIKQSAVFAVIGSLKPI